MPFRFFTKRYRNMKKKLNLKMLLVGFSRNTLLVCACIAGLSISSVHAGLKRTFKDKSEASQYFKDKKEGHEFRIEVNKGLKVVGTGKKVVHLSSWGGKFLELQKGMQNLVECAILWLEKCPWESFLTSAEYDKICKEYDRLEDQLEVIRQTRSEINEQQLYKLYALSDGTYGMENGFLGCQVGFYSRGFDNLTALVESLSLAEHLQTLAKSPLEESEERIFNEEDYRVVAQRLAHIAKNNPTLVGQLLSLEGALLHLQAENGNNNNNYSEEVLRAILTELGLE